MTVSGDARGFRPPASSALALDYRVGRPSTNGLSYPPRHFKKHKVLPHPRRIPSSPTKQDTGHPASNYDLSLDTALASDHGSQPSSPPALKHRVRRIGSGPDPPPTPPTHSRTSSSSHSALPSSPTFVDTPARSTENVRPQPPSTPTNQMSPPTPDVTPPHVRYPKPAIRPLISERIPSKATTDSRTESFKTARENPSSDEEEEEEESSKSTLRPVLASPRTSQSTVRQSPAGRKKNLQPIGLGLGLESSPEASLTPKSRREFHAFDGEWGSSSEVEQEWDDNLERNVTVRKRRAPARVNGHRNEVIEDVTVTPTNAARAVRSLALPERILTFPSPNDGPERPRHQASIAPSTSESSVSTDARRFSGMSSKSTVSTVVEAILVDTPPRRQKTLRHVKKQSLLRDSALDLTPPSSAPTSLLQEEIISTGRRRPMNGRYVDARHESVASAATFNSISSGRARREVWKNGAIPVVIVPDRKSSVKSSREPSLRSTSSRRSRRSQSQGSVPLLQISRSKDLTPYFERPTRRGRAKSESDGSTPGDQRTMDYPPVVPRRTSSLSAPTSRNGSRNGSRTTSLTADSVHARNAVQSQLSRQNGAAVEPDSSTAMPSPPEVKIERAESVEPPAPAREHEPRHEHERDQERRLSVDRHGELFYSKHLSPHNTPFSQASVETTGTSRHSHAEVSEALAVNIYPHQNTSILMVDHRPSESSDGSQVPRSRDTPEADGELEDKRVAAPTIRMTDHDAIGPVTPPQPQFSMDDVDSPLRNPRAPPEPPAIKFIPATPSGLTPAAEKEKQLGNYFDETGDKPTRSKSLVRRVLGGRRHSSYGPSASRTTSLLTRTFSLTRGMRRDTSDNVSLDRGKGPAAPGYESEPADETRLHPLWRPASSYHSGDDDGFMRDGDDDDDETYRYPRIDNRPPPPRRSLSSRMKRTFAILPLQDEDDFYPATSAEFPERRTVRRTPSGNLRVVKHRGSLDSLPRPQAEDVRPYTAPEQHGRLRPFWRSHSLSRGKSIHEPSESRLGRLLPGFSNKIGEYSLQSIPRRLSERRREKRSRELRQKISGPREVRDGVGDVIRRNSYRDNYGDSSSIAGDA